MIKRFSFSFYERYFKHDTVSNNSKITFWWMVLVFSISNNYEAELVSNILIFKTLLPFVKHILIFRTYVLTFSKHILTYTKHILIIGTYILKFFKHILPFTKHILILRTYNNCSFKQVLTFPYRYYLRYKCYRTYQQELSCIKQSGQSYKTYHIQNSTR